MNEHQVSDDHLARGLARQGLGPDQVQKVLEARARIRAQDNGSNRNVADIATIQSSLNELGPQLKAYRDSTEREIGAVRADLQDMQQRVAMMDTDGVRIRGSFSGPSIGSKAIEAFGEDAAFQAAAEVARRGGKIGALEARVNVDGSIRAALVNEDGLGDGTGDTTYPSHPERRGPVGPALAPLRLIDALPSRPVKSDSVEFIQISATGDAAPQSYEGAEKAEIEFEGELETAKVITIAGHTTASVQVLADAPALQQVIDRVLRHKTMASLESQLMYGSGAGSNMEGLMVQASTLTPTIGTTTADIYGEAMVRMADAGYSPNLAIMNPLDWFRLLLTRKGGDDQSYIFGSPTMPIPPALWNTRVVLTSRINEGSGLVLDTTYTTVLDREQVSVVASRSHKDYMTKNLVLILAELRAGLEVTDQNALRKFTLPAPASV